MQADTEKLVIQVENGQPINHPLTYSNFLLLFPECPFEETPTNEVISYYGYEVFFTTPRPIQTMFDKYVYQDNFYTKTENGSWTKLWRVDRYNEEEIIDIKWNIIFIKRDVLLMKCFEVLNNPSLSEQEKHTWEVYKQALDNIDKDMNNQTYSNPDDVKFPPSPQ